MQDQVIKPKKLYLTTVRQTFQSDYIILQHLYFNLHSIRLKALILIFTM